MNFNNERAFLYISFHHSKAFFTWSHFFKAYLPTEVLGELSPYESTQITKLISSFILGELLDSQANLGEEKLLINKTFG